MSKLQRGNWLSLRDAADYTKLSIKELRSLTRRGILSARMDTHGKFLLISTDSLQQLLEVQESSDNDQVGIALEALVLAKQVSERLNDFMWFIGLDPMPLPMRPLEIQSLWANIEHVLTSGQILNDAECISWSRFISNVNLHYLVLLTKATKHKCPWDKLYALLECIEDRPNNTVNIQMFLRRARENLDGAVRDMVNEGFPTSTRRTNKVFASLSDRIMHEMGY